MVKRGHLNVPVIGVAKAGWNLDQLKARAKDSLEKHGGLDPAAFEKLSGLLRYVDGDYNDPATFQAIRKELGSAQRPAHYLAIPPVLFGNGRGATRQGGLRRGRRAGHRRKTVRPRPRFRAASSTGFCSSAFDEKRIFRIDHYLGKQPVHNMLFFRFANALARAVLEPRAHRERADHHGGGFRRAGPRRILRSDRHRPRRDAEPSVPGAGQSGDGAAGPHRQRIHPRRKSEGAEGHPAAGAEEPGARTVPRLSKGTRRGAGFQGRKPLRRSSSTSIPGAGAEFPSTSAPGNACPSPARKSSSGLRQPPTMYRRLRSEVELLAGCGSARTSSLPSA